MQNNSLNKVLLIGNLGQDPEARFTPQGTAVCNLSVATNESWKDQSGEMQDRTEWHRVVIFNENLARIAEQYLRKGSTVYLEGQLQTRKWTDQQGVEKYSTEVVLQRFRGQLTLLGSRADTTSGIMDSGGFGGGEMGYEQTPKTSGQASPPPMRSANDIDDDIPF